MASEPKDCTIFYFCYWKQAWVLNYAYTVKGFQNSLQLFELKEKQQQNNTRYLNIFFVIFFS